MDGPIQPNHAELRYLLSRCYSEGYGVIVDIEEAVKHLYLAAQEDSVEASCFIEMCQPYLSSLPRPRQLRLASNILAKTLENFKHEKARICGHRSKPSNIASQTGLENFEPTGFVRLWNCEDRTFVCSQPFTWRIGDTDRTYEWSDKGITALLADTKAGGFVICDVIISYRTILTPLNTATFYEVCASYGNFSWLQLAHHSIKQPQQYENTSWGRQQEVWERLLNKAAQRGHFRLLKKLLNTVLEAQPAGHWEDQWSSPTGESPLHYLSLLEGDDDEILSTVKTLLKLGINIDTPITTRSWLGPYGLEVHGTPLQMAVRCQCLRVVKALADCGADLTLSFGDSQPPLALAVSMHCPELVSLLLKSTKFSKEQLTDALNNIGVPTKKGWYERVMRMSGSGLSKPLLKSCLAGTSRVLYRLPTWINFRTQTEVPDDILLQMDGAALIEAVSQGQRDIEVFLAMIQLGFGPSSIEGLFNVLKAVLGLSPDDPLRETLLDLVFRKTQHLAEENSGPLPTLRLYEWRNFFKIFRYEDENASDRTVLHFFVTQGDLNAVRFLKQHFPQDFASLKERPDSVGLSPVDLTIDQSSLELYRILTTGTTRDKRKDVQRAKETHYNALLPRLLADEAKQEEHAKLDRIHTMMSLFVFDSSPDRQLHDPDTRARKTFMEKRSEAKLQIAAALEELGYFIDKKLKQIDNVMDSTFADRNRPSPRTTLAETLKDLVGWVDKLGICTTTSSQIQKAEDLYTTALHIRLSETNNEDEIFVVFKNAQRLPHPLRARYGANNMPKQSYAQELTSDPATTKAVCEWRISYLAGRSVEWIKNTRVFGNRPSRLTGPKAILEWIKSGQFCEESRDIWRENNTEIEPINYILYDEFMTKTAPPFKSAFF